MKIDKVSLIPENKFSVAIGNKVYPGFEVVETWEGMVKLKDNRDNVIIIDTTNSRLVTEQEAGFDVTIIKINPDFAWEINQAFRAGDLKDVG